MFNIKIPLYAGIIGFILIVFINIIKGNTLFIIFSRSLFYGLIVFGVFFGILFVLKRYLDIDFEVESVDDLNNEEESSNIDITVGEEELKEKAANEERINSGLFDNIEDNEELDDESLNYNENKKENFNTIDEEEIEKNDEDDFNKVKFLDNEEFTENSGKINEDDERIKEFGDESKSINADNTEEHNIEHDNTYELNELSLDEDSIIEEDESTKKTASAKSIKDKIGVEVSYEDLVKAIRTKIKRDEW